VTLFTDLENFRYVSSSFDSTKGKEVITEKINFIFPSTKFLF